MALLPRSASTLKRWIAGTFTGAREYRCNLCGYRGAFGTVRPETGSRRHAVCPGCGSAERHRLQWFAVEPLLVGTPRLLHFAPEPGMAQLLRARTRYVSADLSGAGVDHRIDITSMPLPAGSFDVVFASHVLEHVKDDAAALREVRRVLAPGGFAVLPVPVIGEHTVEYEAPNPHEALHVRCPGVDYFDRYREVFERVDLVTSDAAPPEIQPYVYERRMRWPSTMPLRPLVPGGRHLDYVPICYP
jgi:SAM-dependent methyltransferase